MRRRSVQQQTEWRAFAGLTVLALALLASHHRARTVKQASLPERAARAVLVPLQQSLTAVWREGSLAASTLAQSRRLARENQELRQRLETAEMNAAPPPGRKLALRSPAA